MEQFVDYYKILGLKQNANLVQIKFAWRAKSLQWHPDVNNAVDSNRRMQDINEAKRILTDKRLREEYNLLYNEKQKEKAKDTKQTEQKETTEEKKTIGVHYVCETRSTDDLVRICKNAARYPLAYISAVITELKKRFPKKILKDILKSFMSWTFF